MPSVFDTLTNASTASQSVSLGARLSPTATLFSALGKRKAKKAFIASIDAFRAGEAKRKSELEARNVSATERFGETTAFRGGLIDAQRGGLASTILNLGGQAGDPTRPFASQLIGTQAAGTEAGRDLELETFTFDSAGEQALVAQHVRNKKKRKFL